MTVIVDYGVGNLFSLKSSLEYIGADAIVSSDTDVIKSAERIILPGVGAFADAAKKLSESGLGSLVCDEARSGKPLMGICLGMQLLFEKSFEFFETKGLGLLEGSVLPIEPIISTGYKIPHIGWNTLHLTDVGRQCPVLKYINDGDFVYFVHSYAAFQCDDSLLAATDYGVSLTAAVGCGNTFGMQFHPEKSGTVGLKILQAFCEL